MLIFPSKSLLLAFLAVLSMRAAQAPPAPSAKPPEHVIGTITAADTAAHTITIKEDKTGSEHVILLANTKTLIKVPPGAKDLKNATRITADQLASGDRVDIRGFNAPDDSTKIAARSVVLMSARDLEAAHAAQAAEWRHSIAGLVTAVDNTAGKITLSARSAQGVKTVVLATSPQTEFTRYSPDTPAKPVASHLAQIQPGDQVRAIGEKSDDGATVTATKVYSGAFRTLNGTVVSITPDGKQLTIRDLATKKPEDVLISDNTSIRKIPPELAARLVRFAAGGGRPSGAGSASSANQSSNASVQPNQVQPNSDAPQGANSTNGPGGPGSGGMRGPRNGDLSQLIERLPAMPVADLKPGDAVVVSGVVTGGGSNQLAATHVIAGVEPILQSAPAASRGGQALGGDWGLGQIEAPQ